MRLTFVSFWSSLSHTCSTQLHSSCSSIQPKDLADLMHTMRVLAKFLGFLQFLPHKNPAPESLLSTREKVSVG